VLGTLGHNGAGKTTTINIINILTMRLKPPAGRASVFGIAILTDPIGARRRINYLPENVRLYGALSAINNLRFFGRLVGPREPDERIQETLLFLECENLGPKPLAQFLKDSASESALRRRSYCFWASLHPALICWASRPCATLFSVSLYYRFQLSLKMAENILAAGGIVIGHEKILRWAEKFGKGGSRQAVSSRESGNTVAGRGQ
jgi:ABC-type Fe3+/spermidine/putrescine transport system ATPase subunit